MSSEPDPAETTPSVVQDAELLYESIREMKHLSRDATSAAALHAMLGHLATAGHLLPEVLTELGESLASSAAESGDPSPEVTAALAACGTLLEEAADLAFRAGTILGQAQKALDPLV